MSDALKTQLEQALSLLLHDGRKLELLKIEYDKLCRDRDKLLEALKPFAAAVFNDNGNVTVSNQPTGVEPYWRAYLAVKQAREMIGARPAGTEAEPK